MSTNKLIDIIQSSNIAEELKIIAEKVFNNERIKKNEGVILFEKGEIGYLGVLANYIREKLHGKNTYFNRNFHIEPTNICIYKCKFCSYSRKINDKDSWEYSIEEIVEKVKKYKNKPVTEVHIVGGVHPNRDIHYYGKMIKRIKEILPKIHVKAFTAIELDFMIKKAGLDLKDGLKILKDYGLDSIPGGGAEIFSPEIREKICYEKSKAEDWLNIHRTAHQLGLKSNATILYGHIENYEHRIDHLLKLRNLQDETNGFNAFIPLKYRNKFNPMSDIGEVNTIEDIKNFAVSRIFLDNFSHLKAYWPMLGKETTQLSLSFGVNDIDGTIDDTTKIYSMAGVEEQKPSMKTEELINLIKDAGRIPVERDTLYKVIREY
ncbi:MAG: aminofutalosine synthase MqnE [Bacteroidales bacterium]|nr:aminofutalosine synthase MqnE [Bacteroidales bacterium]